MRIMPASRRPPALLLLRILVAAVLCCNAGTSALGESETFSEELLLRPLPDGKVVAHFRFRSTLPVGARHTSLFPASIARLAAATSARDFSLALTHGRWRRAAWGAPPWPARPVGAELTAEFGAALPLASIPAAWANLTAALGGIFCASLHALGDPGQSATSSPALLFGPRAPGGANRAVYGALPRESVCTENLSPWLALLPCRGAAGLASRLDRPSVYGTHYHALEVTYDGDAGAWTQALTLVIAPPGAAASSGAGEAAAAGVPAIAPSWSLDVLLPGKEGGAPPACALASLSRIYLDLPPGLLIAAGGLPGPGAASTPAYDVSPPATRALTRGVGGDCDGQGGTVGIVGAPTRWRGSCPSVGGTVLEWDLKTAAGVRSFPPVAIAWSSHAAWAPVPPLLTASRHLTGTGGERGGIRLELRRVPGGPGAAAAGPLSAHFAQLAPWHIRVMLHTLTATRDGVTVPLSHVAHWSRLLPAQDRRSASSLEMALHLPAGCNTTTVSLQFEKAFLRVGDHPPDAARGFDMPAAHVAFAPEVVGGARPDPGGAPPTLGPGSESVILDGLLAPLALPDFSMPFNVVTMSSTLLALFTGLHLAAMMRRMGEEERRERDRRRAAAAAPSALGAGGGPASLTARITAVLRIGE